MEFFISGYLNFQKPLFATGILGEQISILVSWFSMAGTILIAPIGLAYIVDQDEATLETEEFKESFGSLYDGVKTRTRATRSYFMFFIIRRLIFCVTAFFLTWSSTIQIQCILLLNMSMAIYIVYFAPKKLRIFNYLDVFSEFLVQVTTIHLLVFTNF